MRQTALRVLRSCLVFILVFAFGTIDSVAAEHEPTVIRVAFPQVDGFSTIDEQGNRSGLIVDYLNEIAKYTGWEYTYIDVDNAHLIDKARAGDFDLIGGTYRSAAMEEFLAFPDYSTGHARSVLLANWEDTTIRSYDITDLNGKTIGVNMVAKENIRRLKEFMSINEIDCSIQYCNLQETPGGKLSYYLESGKVDLLLGNSVDDNGTFRAVAYFEAQPHYIVTTLDNQEVLEQLNWALSRIMDSNPNFAEERYAANFPSKVLYNVTLNEEEMDYIREKDTVTVVVPHNYHPFFCMEYAQSVHNGMVPDILNRVTKLYGLKFSYLYADTYADALETVKRGEADMAGFFLGDEKEAAEAGLSLTHPFVTLGDLIVRNKSVSYPAEGLTCGILKGRELPDNIQADKIRYFDDAAQALAAVNRGEVDFVFGLSASYESETQKINYPNTIPVSLADYGINISLVLDKPADSNLLTILNKTITSLSEAEKSTITNQNLISIGTSSLTLRSLIYSNPLLCLVVVTVFLLMLVMITLIIARARIKSAVMLAELKKAEAGSRAKTVFLSRMSHEIRTPMNGIIGMTAVAMQHRDDQVKIMDSLKKISLSSKHLLALINDVLDMSRIESGKIIIRQEAFDFRLLIEGITAVIYSQVSAKNLDYETVLIGDIREELVGDSLRVSQIITNLLSNALKFTPEGGKIRLRIYATSWKERHVWLRFEVADSGCGISEENHDKIFEAFEQENPDVAQMFGGTGLGLSIVKRFTELMGGNISVTSKPGVGSTFSVEIPFETVEASQNQAADYDDMKALVVDSEEETCQYVTFILQRLGITADWSDNGQEAIAKVTRAHEQGEGYDLCFLSWKMPAPDGLEITRRILEAIGIEESPAVFITAYDTAEVEEAAKAAGVFQAISKPLFESGVVEALDSFCSGKTIYARKTARPEDYDFRGKRLLIVEDNVLNMEIACELFEMTGAVIEQAHDGQEAVTLFEQSLPGHYDLILMDIQMPNMNGYEATAAIRAMSRPDAKSVSIFAMTANAFAEDVAKSLECGMVAHIPKPLDVPSVLAAMRGVLQK